MSMLVVNLRPGKIGCYRCINGQLGRGVIITNQSMVLLNSNDVNLYPNVNACIVVAQEFFFSKKCYCTKCILLKRKHVVVSISYKLSLAQGFGPPLFHVSFSLSPMGKAFINKPKFLRVLILQIGFPQVLPKLQAKVHNAAEVVSRANTSSLHICAVLLQSIALCCLSTRALHCDLLFYSSEFPVRCHLSLEHKLISPTSGPRFSFKHGTWPSCWQ